MHPKKNLITLVVNVSIDGNSVDPDLTDLIEQSDLGLHCLSNLEASKTFQQLAKETTFVVIGASRVNSFN